MGRGRGTIKFWIFSGASSVQSRGSRGAREGAEARRGEEGRFFSHGGTESTARFQGSGEVLCADGERYCFFWQTVIRDVP